jgi:hypothetical protein
MNKVGAIADKIDTKHLSKRECEAHITVLYGLESDDVAAVQEAVTDFGPVQVTLGKTSCFPASEGGHGDVLKIDVESPDLHRLHDLIKKQPHTSNYPNYVPHLTIAYLWPGEGMKYAGMCDLEGETFTVTHLTFSERSGQRHDIWLCGDRADLATWNETDHPRGQPANRGQFAIKSAPTSAPARVITQEQIEQNHATREQAAQRFVELVNAPHNRGIARHKREAYQETLKHVANHLTPMMVRAILPTIGEIEVFDSVEQLSNNVFPGERLLTGGAWTWDPTDPTGILRVDGDSAGINRYDIYAHELGHALDFKHRHSNTPEWDEAWKEEINHPDKPLSNYATLDKHEGFAEYARLFGTGQYIEAKLFPKCYACFKKWGYL